MKTIFDHIERIQGKPHHIRKQIAFGAAAVGTAIIAFVWLVSSVGAGTFALKDTSFAQSTGKEGTFTATGDTREQLAGVGASVRSGASAPAYIEIIDAASSTSGQEKTEQTTIPF
ncbi:MAG: hypothetical protein AAB831_00785 [Patescibacteria group bacterium]